MKTNCGFGSSMMSKRLWFTVVGWLCLALCFSSVAESAGLLIADGGFGGVLEIKEHEVKVVVNNGVAVTQVHQVFLNKENRQVEALYTFPIPNGASVANFSIWIEGQEMIGEVVEKQRARQIYESYKQTRRDPGLLEQVDYKTFEMRIFPINPGAEQRINLTYYQELSIDHDQGTYLYPLATVTRQDIKTDAAAKFSFNLELKSAVPILNLRSPSHGEALATACHSANYCVAGLETNHGSLAEDVVINFEISRPHSGVDLITSKQSGDDGFFALTITAGKELAEKDAGMDFVFVLDVSGSMANDGKLMLSKKTLDAFIDEIDERDRFEVMAFNLSPKMVFGALKPGADAAKQEAIAFIASQPARGGTELAPAMSAAYKYSDPDRTLNVVILSDGITEQKERQTLLQMIASRPTNARVFCIGVGNEVNRPLLEQIAEDAGGLAAFLSRGDDFVRAAKSFKRKLLRPAATDLRLDFGRLRVYDLEPETLPNLYHGAPIRIYGRYAGGGEAEIRISGNIQGIELKQSLTLVFPVQDLDNPEIDRMWAWKRVDQLLKQADRTNSRTQVLDEIIRLGEDYSIVTPYTSFLALENDDEYKRWRLERRNEKRLQRERSAQARRQEKLALIKQKAVADIGPQAVVKPDDSMTEKDSGLNIARRAPDQSAPPSLRNHQSRDFNIGSGPVGPLFVVFAIWLRRRNRQV